MTIERNWTASEGQGRRGWGIQSLQKGLRRGLKTASSILACATLFIWLAALPPFQVGLWYLTEPVEIALFGTGALAALVLVFHPKVEWAMWHPLVLIPAGLVILTAATAQFHSFPTRSGFGPPQTGEGGLWFAALAMMVALFRVADRRAVAHAACWSGAILLVARWTGPQVNSFPDYLAFVGLALIVIREPRSLFEDAADWPLIIGAALIASSGSKGAFMLVPAIMLVALMRAPRALLAAVVPPLTVIAIDLLHTLPSAGSRVMLWRSAIAALQGEPGLWWHGAGWGGMNDLVARHYRAIAQVEPNWEGLGEAWHSHNEFVEAFISVGIGGAVLMIALFVVAAHASIGRLRAGAWCALAGLSAIWMPTPVVVPFLAAALAITSRGSEK